MTEQEQFERMKLFDYSAFVLRFDKIPEYPQEFAKNAFYGFYLLARCAGSLLSMQASDFSPETAARQGQQLELALSYLESECESGKKNPFLRGRPFTYEMISVLREFILLYNGSYTDSDYTSLIERLNTLVRHSETSRISQNLLRSLDIQLAKQWGRILRVYCFLLAPDSSLPTNYSYERDLHICVKRGTNRDELIYIDFLVRFHRFRKQEKVGKLILLAEEWEMRCMNKCVSGDPDKYERMVLALLDSDAFYKIGLEWVTMSEADLLFTQEFFRGISRDPSVTEIRVLDTYWSDHCRHTTFLTELTDVSFADPDTEVSKRMSSVYEDYLDKREEIYGERIAQKPVCLMDLALMAMWRGVEASVSLPVAQDASYPELAQTRISEQLSKTKSSPFDAVSVVIDPSLALCAPVSFLNELRREGFAALEQQIFAQKHAEVLSEETMSAVRASASAFPAGDADGSILSGDLIHVNYFDLRRILPQRLSVGADYYSFSVFDLMQDSVRDAVKILHTDEPGARFLIWLPGAYKDALSAVIGKTVLYMQ